MKNLIVSIICLLILMVPWGIYHRFSEICTENFHDIITDRIIPAAETGDWQSAEENLHVIAEDWDDLRRVSTYFIDNKHLNDVSEHISRLSCYIKQQDTTDTIAVSSDLLHKFNGLHENDSPSIGNLF